MIELSKLNKKTPNFSTQDNLEEYFDYIKNDHEL